MIFLNSLASYLLLMIIIVIVGAVAIFLGITLRKRKDAKNRVQQSDAAQDGGQAGA